MPFPLAALVAGAQIFGALKGQKQQQQQAAPQITGGNDDELRRIHELMQRLRAAQAYKQTPAQTQFSPSLLSGLFGGGNSY